MDSIQACDGLSIFFNGKQNGSHLHKNWLIHLLSLSFITFIEAVLTVWWRFAILGVYQVHVKTPTYMLGPRSSVTSGKDVVTVHPIFWGRYEDNIFFYFYISHFTLFSDVASCHIFIFLFCIYNLRCITIWSCWYSEPSQCISCRIYYYYY